MHSLYLSQIAGCAAACIVNCSALAQQPPSEGVKQSMVFLEQLVGSWSLLLEKWDRDATTEQWAAARKACQTPIEIRSPRAIASADPAPPPDEMLFGDLVYYRGPDGLQQFDPVSGKIRLYPNLRVGTSKSGTPVYQLSGSNGGGEDNATVLAIGKIPAGEKREIVLIKDNVLYLRCQE